MARCLIGLGSNLGDRQAALSNVADSIERDTRLRCIAKSKWHETKPVGGPGGQMSFLNGAVLLETALTPPAMLELLLHMEAKMGRVRRTTWGPRTIDLDLLLYDEEVVQTDRLTVPHPRMAWRRFVLAPAAEIAGEMVHAGTGWTVARLLHHLDSAHNYVAIAGAIGVGKTWLAKHIAAKTSAAMPVRMPARMVPVRMITEQLDAQRLKRFYDNPAGTAWAMELEFLEQRSRLLAAEGAEWSDRHKLAVSDFWFDQSAAFASVWLGKDEFGRFHRRWLAARAGVVQPKLTVVLSEPKHVGGKPGDWLLQRVRGRGRDYETRLSADVLSRIERAVARQADEPDLGPILRLSAGEPQVVIDEVMAAIEGMQ